jgi:hypothetical protein
MPDMGVGEIIAAIVGLASAGTTAYSAYQHSQDVQAQLQAQQKAQQQAQQQALSQRRQQMLAAAPSLQSQTSGFLGPQAFQGILAELTGNPGFQAAPGSAGGGGGGGGLTPAMENLFPGQGGAPSLTEPWPMMNA